MSKTRLMIDFDDAEGAVRFVMELRRLRLIPTQAGMFEVDALDFMPRSGGVGRRHSFLLRHEDNATGRKRLTATTREELTA